MTTRVGEAASQWGGPVGLALFALWALWMLNRSMKRAPDGGTSAATGKLPAGKAVGMVAGGRRGRRRTGSGADETRQIADSGERQSGNGGGGVESLAVSSEITTGTNLSDGARRGLGNP